MFVDIRSVINFVVVEAERSLHVLPENDNDYVATLLRSRSRQIYS